MESEDGLWVSAYGVFCLLCIPDFSSLLKKKWGYSQLFTKIMCTTVEIKYRKEPSTFTINVNCTNLIFVHFRLPVNPMRFPKDQEENVVNFQDV